MVQLRRVKAGGEVHRREGISEREFEKYQEAIDIVEIGGRFDLARGSVVLGEVVIAEGTGDIGVNNRHV